MLSLPFFCVFALYSGCLIQAVGSPSVADLPKPPAKLSYNPPSEVDFIHQPHQDDEVGRPYFADFAWREFIALNWPALPGVRGKPNAAKQFGSPADNVVWETWKTMADLFPASANGQQPTAWTDTGGESPRFQRHFSNADDIIQQTGFGLSSRPLVAQNHTYVRYEIRVNQTQYEYVVSNKFYLREGLPKGYFTPLPHPEKEIKSIIVKAAWRVIDVNDKTAHKYFHAPCWLATWDAKGAQSMVCKEMALVGLHIIQKTPLRPNWVWATFEHVDNTEVTDGSGIQPSFNSGKLGMTAGDDGWKQSWPAIMDLPKTKPQCEDARLRPVEVVRAANYNLTLEAINKGYQEHPEIQKTVWKNYRLVGVQWPKPPGTVLHSEFPTSGVANATIETYQQGFSCMACHSSAPHSGLIFYLQRRAVGEGQDPLMEETDLRIRELLNGVSANAGQK